MTCSILLAPLAFLSLLHPPAPAQVRIQPEPGRTVVYCLPETRISEAPIYIRAEQADLLEVSTFSAPNVQLAINQRDLSCGLLRLKLRLKEAGSEARINLTSQIFDSGSELFLYHPAGQKQRLIKATRAEGSTTEGEYRLSLALRDGDDFDLDGEGLVEVVLGPRQVFWSQALLTMMIRFIGVFLVLGVLMLAMMFSGVVFSRLASDRQEKPAFPTPPEKTEVIQPAQLAALALALYLEERPHISPAVGETSRAFSAWAQAGRLQLMRKPGDRR